MTINVGDNVKLETPMPDVWSVTYVSYAGDWADLHDPETGLRMTLVPVGQVTKVVEYWPPQAGDIWEADNGEEYAAVTHSYQHTVYLTGTSGNDDNPKFYSEHSTANYTLDSFRDTRHPVIRRRKGVTL